MPYPLLFLTIGSALRLGDVMTDNTFTGLESRARAVEQTALRANSYDDVLKATVSAAELYLQALRKAPTASDKRRIESKCKELLTRAEKLKKPQTGRRPSLGDALENPHPNLQYPVSKRKLTTREEIILLEGCNLNGFVFPPWKDAPEEKDFERTQNEELFEDKPKLQLSSDQSKSFAGWKRPHDALATIRIERDGRLLPNAPSMTRGRVVDLVQDMTSDCSVVATLCAGTARVEKGHPTVSAEREC